MTNLDNRIERASCGEYRVNPDEQKLYLNTYRERVLLAVTFSDAENTLLKPHFDQILSSFDGQYDKVSVKISGNLPDALSAFYLKTADNHQFSGQILLDSPSDVFGLVIHTDHAVNLEKISLSERFPEIRLTDATLDDNPKKKKGFLENLFD
ncbi:DUF1694 domain-containing protein [Lactococcus insecticola]|uniref:DUF1694 domain-containing protein n=1 Tax=Pseudolactococcus insecticola TaxID=2709158 RepID=A0A6A0B666_9LACT|nr:DUF1694 domain-containing protein [Lactococcus insecticola]GFH40205.1 hypothetical protein Hs20B_06030 [Lactococcus insecticola]